MKSLRWILIGNAAILLVLASWFWVHKNQSRRRYHFLSCPSPQAVWPWKKARRSTQRAGITRWQSVAADGTTLDLFELDFAKNHNLKLALYDQDEDDALPFDNRVNYWNRGIFPVAQKLNRKLQGDNRELVALWNGSFFGLKNLKPRENDFCFHLAPIVLNGKVLYNTGNHRWSFGVKYKNKKPQFQVLHLPGRKALEENFDFATGATQCLIKDGAALKIEDFPRENQKPKKQPVASTPREAGHIPILDHMKTSRMSVAWTRDSSKLFLLFVKEPDGETPSRAAVERRIPSYGGWMLADVQRFWLSAKQDLEIENAVALDGGDVAQMGFWSAPNTLEFVPSRLAIPDLEEKSTRRVRVALSEKTPPPMISRGGSIMYFYVSDAKDNRQTNKQKEMR